MAKDDCHSFSSIQDATICHGTAIIAEGGGQRGIYTAGVLDAFLGAGFNPFELAIGASAGAQNLLTYFIGLPGYAKRAIAELSGAPSFMVPYRWLGKRGMLDLDTYFSHLADNPDFRLPCGHVDGLAGRRRLVFAATRQDDLSAIYLEPDSRTVLRDMKASSAVPFLYKGGVSVDSEILVDGCVADPLPLRRAYALGARRIVLIRTVPSSYTNSSWRQRLNTLRLGRALPTTVSAMLERHEHAYDDALDFIRHPPAGVDLVHIAPDEPLRSLVFGSRSDALMADYATGCRAGNAALARLYRWQHVARAPFVLSSRDARRRLDENRSVRMCARAPSAINARVLARRMRSATSSSDPDCPPLPTVAC